MKEYFIKFKNESIEQRVQRCEVLFPHDFITQRRFVLYNNRKIPLHALTETNINVTDNSNLVDFSVLHAKNYKNSIAKGIGVVLGNLNDQNEKTLCGIDIDDCIDSEGNIESEAQNIIDLLDSYTELSVSGTGIHILFYAEKSTDICKVSNYKWCKALEIYDSKRYFTLSGIILQGKDIIQDRQEECNLFCNKYMTSKEIEDKDTSNNYNLNKSRLDEYSNGVFTTQDESKKDYLLAIELLKQNKNNIEKSKEDFLNTYYAKNKDLKHKKKLERKDYLHRTFERALRDITYPTQSKTNNILLNNNSIADLLKQKILSLPKKYYRYPQNDKGTSEIYSEVFKDVLRYDETAKSWRYYKNGIWKLEGAKLISERYAKHLYDVLQSLSFSEECFSDIEDEESREMSIKKYRKYISKLGNKNTRDNIIKDAQERHFLTHKDLDKNTDLYNCKNGVYNLKNGVFLPHNPEYLLSKISNVHYKPEAKSDIFIDFINRIMEGDTEKIEFLQKIMGLSLTSDTSQECFFILYGQSTRNGKSTLIETIAHMHNGIEGYSAQMKPESLAIKQHSNGSGANGDIARLSGVRFLSVSEPPKKMVFDVSLVKTLTGNDIITARHLYEKEFQYKPYFKLVINTNYLPLINDDTLFSSGRVNVLTFNKHFTPEEQDKNLKNKLTSEENISGIFNWCLEGLRKYKEEGLTIPTVVKNANEEYRKNSDKVALFISECLEPSEDNLKARDVYNIYVNWCKAYGYGFEGYKTFNNDMRNKNIVVESATINKVTHKNVIKGYSIISEWNSK